MTGRIDYYLFIKVILEVVLLRILEYFIEEIINIKFIINCLKFYLKIINKYKRRI